jgi:CRISPR/Cas system-associated endonuclease/helicase Cas3
MSHICDVSKTFGEWYQKTNKTEDKNKLTLLAFKLIAILQMLTSYIRGPTFGNAESRLFLFAAHCFNTESMQKVILRHSCV